MWHTSAFDQFGLLTYADHILPGYPRGLLERTPIWDFGSDDLHKDRIRQDFSVAYCGRTSNQGYYSFRSPEDGATTPCIVEYRGIDASVLCRWKCAPVVSFFTKNEQTVLRLAMADMDNKKIAAEMDLSESGVSYLWSQIREKVHKETNIGAVLYVRDNDLLDEP